jgi:hypothetical protein
MPESSNGWAPPAILIVVSGVLLLVGFGLCGAGGGGGIGKYAGAGLICVVGSALGLLVGFIWLIVALIIGANRK